MTWRDMAQSRRNRPVIALVAALFFTSCPFAVAGFVPLVVVDSLDAQAGRRLSHVHKESVEGQPRGTHAYAAATVVTESCDVWICAALNHGVPNAVSFASGHAMRLIGAFKLPLPAPATGSVAVRKIAGADNDFCAAITPTQPSNDWVAANGSCIFGSRDCNESAVPLSSDVVSVCHGRLYNGIKYDIA